MINEGTHTGHRKVSVAMATCNGGRYIAAQIASILAQNLPPAEIVVSDDASTDDTISLLEALHEEGKIRLFKNEERTGVIRNFKKAVRHCDPANYIALSDQDDCWLPEKLRENAFLLGNIDRDDLPCLIFSDLEMTDEGMNTLQPSFWKVLNVDPARETLHSLLFGNFITGCTVMMNPAMAALLHELPEEGAFMHDAWLGLAGYTFGRSIYSRKPLVRYRQHGSNVTFETNQKTTLKAWAVKNFRQMTGGGSYLKNEGELAEKFYDCYGQRMTSSQKKIFEGFLRLRTSGFIPKKIAALRARAYRYTGDH